MPVINGWTVLAHPLFLDQLEKLTIAVEKARQKSPDDFRATANAKLLAALAHLVFDKIPQDPTANAYRQGNTLGKNKKHWFRAKFGNGRFRLFFRYSSTKKIIIFVWVNDENTLRTYGAKSDAYSVFKGMVESGNPPDDWDGLEKQASSRQALSRLDAAHPTEEGG